MGCALRRSPEDCPWGAREPLLAVFLERLRERARQLAGRDFEQIFNVPIFKQSPFD